LNRLLIVLKTSVSMLDKILTKTFWPPRAFAKRRLCI